MNGDKNYIKESHHALKVFSLYLYWLIVVKVAHHTWIKFLKSRRNSLMMKNEVTYYRKQMKNHFLVKKNMTFKKLFQ